MADSIRAKGGAAQSPAPAAQKIPSTPDDWGKKIITCIVVGLLVYILICSLLAVKAASTSLAVSGGVLSLTVRPLGILYRIAMMVFKIPPEPLSIKTSIGELLGRRKQENVSFASSTEEHHSEPEKQPRRKITRQGSREQKLAVFNEGHAL